ncbi:hypothetical protein B5F83_01270 [Muribaculum sp. An289]|jgi:uncharacterized YigZ family protein|uniref:YigZ family protein n=1 Tax=Candidatus Merdivivens faecigallinarum TaxID=2840871 RepID=A0A9D9J0D6_9BACT|nr:MULTISPECIES: YigZ family protein [unclassified Muribaculum]MBO8482007.1 YigZ family protein [Candidatus Merdivivens faecigallinarum]OUO38519.1 hypothetical protein B5F83_01270 [Muribaculum sp. An289]OUO44010.1 hypothetical protein B5F81_02245 [Muribaculum sp. An287]
MANPESILDFDDCYKSIGAPSEGLYKDNGSRFIALAFPVTSEEEVKGILSSVKKKYYDARHHCYAYRIGWKGETFRSNDDGEPSSSAGKPILNQILSHGLSDILIVVVRYFGGIKLGIPGLIRAYKTSAADAIGNAAIIEKTACKTYRLDFGYMEINQIMKIIKDMGLVPERQEFGMTCTMTVPVRIGICAAFEKAVSEAGGCNFRTIGND